MKLTIGVLVLAAMTAACTNSGTGGAGEPMTARMTVVAENGAHTIAMTSRSGYTCTAQFDYKAYMAAQQPSQTLPVTCDNGDRGTAVYTNANFQKEAFTKGLTQISYQLESGTKGTILL